MSVEKFALVTGCSSGFGRLIALALARRGYHVFATLRQPEGRDAPTAAELRAARDGTGSIVVLAMNVAEEASVAAAFQQLGARTKRLDVVVNNAGLSAMGLNEGFSSEQFQELLAVNAVGPHRVNRAALPLMKPYRRGLLLHISTGLARLPLPCFGLYTASKAALEALAEAYRYELAPLGIDSVLVEPAAYPTRLGASALGPSEPERLAEYGALAELPSRMMETLGAWFSGPHAPRPEAVADAVVALVERPAGSRPLRTTVGGGPDELNALSDRLQAEMLSSQGLESLLKLDTSGA